MSLITGAWGLWYAAYRASYGFGGTVGVLWGILRWINLGRLSARRWWIGSAFAAIVVLTCVELLAGFGVIGKTIIG